MADTPPTSNPLQSSFHYDVSPHHVPEAKPNPGGDSVSTLIFDMAGFRSLSKPVFILLGFIIVASIYSLQSSYSLPAAVDRSEERRVGKECPV